MTASVSRRLNVLWIMIKIIDFPLKNLFTWYYLKTLRVEAWVHETSLTTPRSIEIPVPRQTSERSGICVKSIHFASFYAFDI